MDFSCNKDGRAVFSGVLSTRLPKDGRIKFAGYCNVRCPTRYVSLINGGIKNVNGTIVTCDLCLNRVPTNRLLCITGSSITQWS